jgi:hypothetical protein
VKTAIVYWRMLFSQPWETLGHPTLNALVVFLVLFMCVQLAGRYTDWRTAWRRVPGFARGLLFGVLVYLVLFGAVPVGERFVYYQF